MPYIYAGRCLATTGEAHEAFQKSFPIVGEASVVDLHASSINAAGVISYSVGVVNWNSNNKVSKSATINLVSCSAVDTSPAFDPVAAGGVFAFFFLGVAGTWFLAQNLGLILEAVKKW